MVMVFVIGFQLKKIRGKAILGKKLELLILSVGE
jgi:hypothetical protein